MRFLLAAILTLALSSAALAAWDPDLSGAEGRGGFFIQDRSFLVSGGAFWAPEGRIAGFGNWDLYITGRVGAWILTDQTSNPAFTPIVQAGLKVLTPAFGKVGKFSGTLLFGGGGTLMVDKPLLEIGVFLAKELETRFYGLTSFGVQTCFLMAPGQLTFFVGPTLLWRW